MDLEVIILSYAKIRAAKPQDKAYKLTDCHRLYLLVKPSGSKPLRKGRQPAIADLVLLRAMIIAAEEDYARPDHSARPSLPGAHRRSAKRAAPTATPLFGSAKD